MARIRTIKPEFFRHEGLYDLEQDTLLPIRLAFAGLWTECDKEGRFQWRPRMLKAAIMPYDDVDFSRVLDALATRGFVVRYACPEAPDDRSRDFGCIPSWRLHQIPNNREKASQIPPPSDACPTREPRVPHAASVEGEREGNGIHIQPCAVREGNLPEPAKAARVPVGNPPKSDAELRPLFDAYCAGTGQRLTWRHQYVLPCEQIAVLTRDAAVVQRAARFYAQALGVGITPSLQRFAAEFDKWRAESERPAREATKQRRDDPRFGAPSPASRRLWCSRCMTTHPEGQHVALATA